MALASAAHAGQTRMADVLYTHFDDVPTRAFRVGDEAFVAVDDVKRWGWEISLWADQADVKAEGTRATVPFRVFSGRKCIPVRTAMQKLGGGTAWAGSSDTLEVFSELKEVIVDDGRIEVVAPLAVKPRFSVLTGPNRLVVDMTGARLASGMRQDLDGSARLVQYKPNVVRLIVETGSLPDVARLSQQAGRRLEFEVTRSKPLEEEPVEPIKVDEPEQNQPNEQTIPPISGDALDVPLLLDQETNTLVKLRIPLKGRLTSEAQFRKSTPTQLDITLPGVRMDLPEGFTLDTSSIRDFSVRHTDDATVLSLTLARPMGAEVVSLKGDVQIQLFKPAIGDGRLAGKVIVVDPGHGGHDGGAKSGGVREKDLNLKIGKLIAQELAEQGATVIMTRKTDVFISLSQRAKIANASNADLFISTHINSTGGSGSQSGTITFHHKGKPVGRLLAECIHNEIGKVNGLPDIGVWSDGKIYKSGFAVLRQTKMPGVLLELGFINHSRDRNRMVTQDFQTNVAAAVVRGIKVFLGDAEKN